MRVLQERLSMTLPKIVEMVSKREINASRRYLVFEVSPAFAVSGPSGPRLAHPWAPQNSTQYGPSTACCL